MKTFLETRGWKFEVALDANQRVGQNFGVEGIPHTVVIGQDAGGDAGRFQKVEGARIDTCLLYTSRCV